MHAATDGPSGIFRDLSAEMAFNYRHKENLFSDFNRERLIYHMLSTPGPNIAIADVNGDGREDLFIGGAKDSPGAFLEQQGNGKFRSINDAVLVKNLTSEDTDCLFFDADGDGDQDLYVASGGNELPSSSSALIDRLYINDGKGQFELSDQILPTSRFESTSTVEAGDYDGDGDLDLFVGIRLRPFLYGVPVNAYLLQNDGSGKFSDVTASVAPELSNLGMITDGLWSDFDTDGDLDLIVTGEWMPITLFENREGHFTKVENGSLGIGPSSGWWNCIKEGDFNGDNKPDYVLGNHGWNSRFRASAENPLVMYINDFDQNGSAEQIIARKEDGKYLPYARRHDLVTQMPAMKKKYLRYSSYVGQGVEDIFNPDQLAKSIKLSAEDLASSVLLSQPDGTFILEPLPKMAQLSPIYGLLVYDFDGDGLEDILLGGNLYDVKPEAGRYDANYGLFLRGNGQGQFTPVPSKGSGFKTYGQVRDLKLIHIQGRPYVLVARNNDTIQVFGFGNDES
ncbi:MAG: VCBS repeat-containing protein [Lewinella sp.]|nr:VCBS repeat-containing protein [Lewinella sp.]